MEKSVASHVLRRPVVCLTLVFILGTYSGLVLDLSAVRLVLYGLLAWLLAFLSLLRSRAQNIYRRLLNIFTTSFILGCAFIIAWLSASIFRCNIGAECKTPISGRVGEYLEITGVVAGDPDVLLTTATNRVVAEFPFSVESIGGRGKVKLLEKKCRVKVLFYGGQDLDVPLYGERWCVFGKICAGKQKNPDLNRQKSQLTVIRADSSHARFVSAGAGWWLAERCYSARRAAATCLSAGIEKHDATVDVLHSLILGYKRLTREMKQVYIFTGTLHIFAISGSHVVVFGSIIICVLGMFRISSVYWGLFLGPVLCAYVFATGFQSSAVRACIMAVIYWGAPLLGRREDGLTALCVSAMVILAVVPSQLFNAGFILSFVCVLGLIVLYQPINAPVQKLLEPDPLRLQPESKIVVVLRSVGSVIWSTIAMSLAAWLASAPLTAYYFGNFTPMGLVANLIVIPVSFFVILAGCLSLVFGACIQSMAVIFNHANLALIGIMMKSMEWLAQVPYGNIKIENVPVWGIIAWYGLLAVWVVWLKERSMDVEKAESV